MSFLNNSVKIPKELIRLLGSVLGVVKKEKGRADTEASAKEGEKRSGGLNPGLSTQEAADLLMMTRPELEDLLDEGRLPFKTRGEERHISLKDLQRYRKQRQAEREARLKELENQLKELKKS